MFASLPLDDLLQRAPTLYTNARDNADISAALADPYEYGPDDYAQGLALVEEASRLSAEQAEEYRESADATRSAQATEAALRRVYTAHRKLARTKVQRADGPYNALGLRGELPTNRPGLFKHAEDFYRALQNDPTPVAGARGLNAAAFERGLALVAQARQAATAQIKEEGEAEQSTTTRDAAVGTLRSHAGELAAVAKIALADRPDLLGLLGL